jgi:hypothetical protein
MRKLSCICSLFLLIAISVAVSVSPVQKVSAFAGGTGASGSPYQISTCAELLKIDDTTANLSKAFLLTGNIDCTGVTVSPMVNGSTYFTGTLDGGGFEIKGLSLSCSTVYCGLFHTVTSGTVKNIVFDAPVVASTSSYVGVVAGSVGARTATAIFEDVVIRSMNVDASGVVGGIAGICTACSVAGGSVSGSVDAGLDKVGGLFGLVGEALYSHLFSVGDVSTSADVSGRDYVGGIVGQAYRATYTSTVGVFQTTVSPTVSVTGRDYVGGVVGHTSYTGGFNFEDIGSHASVSGATYVGGIIGWSRGSSERVYRSYSTGELSQTNSSCGSGVGGITASNDSEGFLRIIESYSTSSITGACRFGGLVGNASTNRCTITDSFFRGSLTRAAGSTDSVIGGITGRGCTSITRGYAATNALQAFGGGVSNDVSLVPVCTDVYWDMESSGQSSTRCTATGKTSAQMKTQATFTNFDFASKWIIDSAVNNGYPFLLGVGVSSLSGGSSWTPPDVTVPTLTSGALDANGTSLVLTFSEPLHATTAAASAFTVTASAVLLTPTSAVVSGSTVVLTLSRALGPLAVITVAYVAPASNAATSNAAVQDLAGNDAASFSGRSATNNSTADIIAPTASWTEPTTPSSSRTLSYTLTFSEAVSGIVVGDFGTIGTATGCVITTASGAANLSVVITVTCSSDGTVTLRLRSGSVLDASSNTGPTSDALATAVTITSPAVTTTVASTTTSPAVTTTTVVSTTTVQPTGTTTTVTTAPSGTGVTATTVPVTVTTLAVGQSSISTVTTVVGNTNTSSTTVTMQRDTKAVGAAAVVTTTTKAPVVTTTTIAKLAVLNVPRTEVGGSSVLIGGKVVEGVITRENNRLTITAGPMVVRIWAVAADGSKLSLDADGRLRVKAGDSVTVDATGFSFNTRVEVRLYSDPVLLGRTDVDDKGVMNASYEIPEGIPSGNHNVVLAGERDGSPVTMALSVALGEQSSGNALAVVFIGVLVAAGVTALMLPAFLRRRRKDESGE